MADMKAVKRALSEAMALVDSADVQGLRAMRGQHAEPDADDMGGPSDNDADNCPECKAGTCTNPEHMTDDDAKGMAALYGDT